MSGGHKDILGMRAGAKVAAVDDEADPRFYQAYSGHRNGRPVMSVDIVLKSGRRQGFYYHDIKFPEYEMSGGEEIISFLAPPKVVVISGKHIEQIYDGLLRLTLKSVYEYDGRPTKAGDPVVTGIEIAEPSSKDRDEKKLELITPAKKAI